MTPQGCSLICEDVLPFVLCWETLACILKREGFCRVSYSSLLLLTWMCWSRCWSPTVEATVVPWCRYYTSVFALLSFPKTGVKSYLILYDVSSLARHTVGSEFYSTNIYGVLHICQVTGSRWFRKGVTTVARHRLRGGG